jgi:prepilin-type N-terminal cleavage/methylation domain-containing protein
MLKINRRQLARLSRGFSLIELMISVTIGLIVAAGAVSLVVSIDKSNSESIQSTRLTQELRALAGVIADDLKRTKRMYDPIADVGQGSTTNCPTASASLKTPLQPCYTFSTQPSGATATKCVTYGYTGSISGTTVYNYRSVRRAVDGSGVGSIVLDQNVAIDGSTAGTSLLTSTQQATCPIPSSTSYTLSSAQVDVTSVCFSSFADGKTCYFNTSDNTCELNTTAVVAPSANEVDICIAGKMRAGDTYTKTITKAFVQPVYIRSMSVN